MPGRLWGLVIATLLTASTSVIFAGGGGSVVFLVFLTALVMLPLGFFIGLLAERLARR